MKKATLIKLLCLALACFMLLPMVIACGEEAKEDDDDGKSTTTTTAPTTGSSQGGTDDSGETVTIAFRLNGGTIVDGANAAVIAKGGKLTAVPECTRDGFVLKGWSYTPNGLDLWEADDTFAKDTLLYAVWEEASASTDSSNGGTDGSENTDPSTGSGVPGTDDSDPSTDTSIPGTDDSDPSTDTSVPGTEDSNDPSTDSSVPGTDDSDPSTDTSIPGTDDSDPSTDSSVPGTEDSNDGPGVDEPKDVTVTFDGNGGTVTGNTTVEIELGGKLTYADVPAVERDGYTLKGWAFDPFGNEMWSARNDTFSEDSTLFAIWEKDASTDSNVPGTDDSKPGTDDSKPGTTTPTVVGIVFDANGGSIVVDYIEIAYGSKLAYKDIPTPTRTGYTLKGWAYDPFGNEMWSARNDIFTDEETTLYAVWEKDASTDSSNNPSTDSSNQGGTNPDVPSNNVLVEFDTGTGYFEDPNDYEISISAGSRIPSFPTPIHDDPSMIFDGWFMDSSYTIVASRSTKINENTVIYAKWKQMVECSDGSYDHVWGSWDQDSKPDCKNAGKDARYCSLCGNKDVKDGDPALGHLWNSWEEAFMRKERSCGRLGCTEKEIINYQDVTISVLGNTPGAQIEGSTDKFYNVPFANLVNGRWDEGFGEFIGPRGNGAAYVQFNLIEATQLDRIYFKGDSVTAINVFVQYEGESDFVLVGVCSSAPDKESTPFVSPDATKKIVAVKFQEDNPPQGTSKWQEVAFVKVAAAE